MKCYGTNNKNIELIAQNVSEKNVLDIHYTKHTCFAEGIL